jgi:hypothetical protein
MSAGAILAKMKSLALLNQFWRFQYHAGFSPR